MQFLSLDQRKFLEQHLTKEVFKTRITLGQSPYGLKRAIYCEGLLHSYMSEDELFRIYHQEFNKRKYFY